MDFPLDFLRFGDRLYRVQVGFMVAKNSFSKIMGLATQGQRRIRVLIAMPRKGDFS